MGSICVQKSNHQFLDHKPKYDTLDPQTLKYFQPPKENKMVTLLNEYMKHYGRKADKQTEQFIDKNYLSHYSSNRTMLNGTLTYTFKYQLINALKRAREGGYYTSRLNMKKVNDDRRQLEYDWEVVVPSRTGDRDARFFYNCKLQFSHDYKFQRLELKEYDPLKEYHQQQQRKAAFYRTQDQERAKKIKADMAFQQERRQINKQAQQFYAYQKRQQELRRIFNS